MKTYIDIPAMRLMRPVPPPPSPTVERIAGLRRLAQEAFLAYIHATSLMKTEQRQLGREILASHESGMRVRDIARVHGVTPAVVTTFIQQWRKREGVTVRGRAIRG